MASEWQDSRQTRPDYGQRHILAAAASGVTAYIGAKGGDAETVLMMAGVDAGGLSDPKRAVDLGSYVRMMELAAQATGDDNFGLGYGQQFRPERLGLIGEIVLASPTVGAALGNLARLFPYHQQATETRFVHDGAFFRLEYRILDGRIVARRQDAELTMGMFANVLRRALGPDWRPDETHFEHPRPEAWRPLEQAFDAPAHFGQRANALVFRRVDLDRAMPGGDLRRLDRLKRELLALAGSPGGPTFLGRVRGEIRSRLADGDLHVGAVADALGVPRWTMQRRLTAAGLSFSQVVEGVRRDLALLYLRERHVPVGDVGALLGYSEISAFSRACRRWFGASPEGLRRLVVGALK